MEGFRHDVCQICKVFHGKCKKYNKGNEAIEVEDLATDGDTRNRSLVNVVGAKVDKEGKYTVYESLSIPQ